MVATIVFYAVMAVLLLWGAWNLFFSVFYISRNENGNLIFFGMLNCLSVIVIGIFDWVMSNQAWQKFWMDSTVNVQPWLNYMLIFYVVLTVLQFLLSRERKVAAA